MEKVINKAKDACENRGISVFEHLPNVRNLSKCANNAEIEIKDYIMEKIINNSKWINNSKSHLAKYKNIC